MNKDIIRYFSNIKHSKIIYFLYENNSKEGFSSLDIAKKIQEPKSSISENCTFLENVNILEKTILLKRERKKFILNKIKIKEILYEYIINEMPLERFENLYNSIKKSNIYESSLDKYSKAISGIKRDKKIFINNSYIDKVIEEVFYFGEKNDQDINYLFQSISNYFKNSNIKVNLLLFLSTFDNKLELEKRFTNDKDLNLILKFIENLQLVDSLINPKNSIEAAFQSGFLKMI